MFETSNNMKERWDAIRMLINRNKTKSRNFPIKNSTMGQHFSTIANKLNSKIPNVDFEVLKSADNISPPDFSFSCVDASIIYNTINKLNTKKVLVQMAYLPKF